MYGITFLQDLAVVMIVAGVVTILLRWLKQPVVLGYIVAGVIIGPHPPSLHLISDEKTIRTLADLGIVFMMFSLGLEFNLRRLKTVGLGAFLAAALEILLMFWVGYEVGRYFDWGTINSLFLGAMISISSTTIIVKTLGELGKSKEKFAELIFAILLIEDILAIVMIALLSGIAMTGSLHLREVSVTLGRLAAFLAAALVGGLLVVPRLLAFVGRFRRNEMLLVTVLGLCFGFSLLAVKLGYSTALGAFVMGAIIAEAREIGRIEHLTEPIRDMFGAVFFVAIGLLIEPRLLLDYAAPITVIACAVVLGKAASCTFGAFVAGHDSRTALRVGTGLAQIGEFSFIIASLGMTLKVTSGFLYPIAVAVSAITTFLTPFLIRSADAWVDWCHRGLSPGVAGYLHLYTQWVGQLGSRRQPSFALRLARRWAWQMALNLALTTAIFGAAAVLVQRHPAWLEALPGEAEGLKALAWLAAVLLALPLLYATFRKLQALGLLVADISVRQAGSPERVKALRAIVANGVPLAGSAGLALLVLALSSALLPPFEVVIVLLLLVVLLAWLLRRSFVKVYARAQVALRDTLTQPPPARTELGTGTLPPLLRHAGLETVVVGAASPAARRLIRELQLRTRTGASIVGIERAGESLINPGPDEELQPGDSVLLLGSRAQLEAARPLLSEPKQDK